MFIYLVCVCVCVWLVQEVPLSFFFTHAYTPHPLPPWCDNYLVVMDKVEVLAVEVVRPGHRSRGDRSKDRVLVPPSISPLSSSLLFFNTKQQLKVTSNKATTFKLICAAQSLEASLNKEHYCTVSCYIFKRLHFIFLHLHVKLWTFVSYLYRTGVFFLNYMINVILHLNQQKLQ